VQEFYHVQGERNGKMTTIFYRRINNLNLFMNASQVVVEILDRRIKEV